MKKQFVRIQLVEQNVETGDLVVIREDDTLGRFTDDNSEAVACEFERLCQEAGIEGYDWT